jgi:phenylpyruvate tautomerase PptA (4-oxalocrotonate tautomerase family)
MPMIDLTYPATVLLRAERAPDTEFFRGITWCYVHELPAEMVLAAGRPVAAPTFRIEVTTPEGALSERRRAELVAEATRVVRERAGLSEEDAMRVWVLCHEVPEGRWGAAGHVVQFQQLLAAAKSERARDAEPAPAG